MEKYELIQLRQVRKSRAVHILNTDKHCIDSYWQPNEQKCF